MGGAHGKQLSQDNLSVIWSTGLVQVVMMMGSYRLLLVDKMSVSMCGGRGESRSTGAVNVTLLLAAYQVSHCGGRTYGRQ